MCELRLVELDLFILKLSAFKCLLIFIELCEEIFIKYN